jgi:hypothetical protein
MVVEVLHVEVEVEDSVVKFARAQAHCVHELIRHVTVFVRATIAEHQNTQ